MMYMLPYIVLIVLAQLKPLRDLVAVQDAAGFLLLWLPQPQGLPKCKIIVSINSIIFI